MREDPASFEPWVPSGVDGAAPRPAFSVASATQEDIEGCVGLATQVSDGANVDWEEVFRHDLQHDERHLVVARLADTPIGYGRTAWFEPGPGAPVNAAPKGYYLIGLVVEPGWRRRGVASALIDARLAWVSQRAREAWYFADRHNHVSIRLHERMGFSTVTDDFWFPTVTDGSGSHVLGRVAL